MGKWGSEKLDFLNKSFDLIWVDLSSLGLQCCHPSASLWYSASWNYFLELWVSLIPCVIAAQHVFSLQCTETSLEPWKWARERDTEQLKKCSLCAGKKSVLTPEGPYWIMSSFRTRVTGSFTSMHWVAIKHNLTGGASEMVDYLSGVFLSQVYIWVSWFVFSYQEHVNFPFPALYRNIGLCSQIGLGSDELECICTQG